MAMQKQDDQHEHTFSNYVRIRDVVQKTCLRRWTIGKSGERGSGISVQAARHDDDDDDDIVSNNYFYLEIVFFVHSFAKDYAKQVHCLSYFLVCESVNTINV